MFFFPSVGNDFRKGGSRIMEILQDRTCLLWFPVSVGVLLFALPLRPQNGFFGDSAMCSFRACASIRGGGITIIRALMARSRGGEGGWPLTPVANQGAGRGGRWKETADAFTDIFVEYDFDSLETRHGPDPTTLVGLCFRCRRCISPADRIWRREPFEKRDAREHTTLNPLNTKYVGYHLTGSWVRNRDKIFS